MIVWRQGGARHGAQALGRHFIDLYDLGGLVDNAAVMATPIDATILPLHLTLGEKADLLDFLQHDPRVAAQTAPFDRPLLSTE